MHGVLPEHVERPVEHLVILGTPHERGPAGPERGVAVVDPDAGRALRRSAIVELVGTVSPAPRSTRVKATAISPASRVLAMIVLADDSAQAALEGLLDDVANPCCSTRWWSSRYLSTVPSVVATACSSRLADPETTERRRPVDRLGDARRLVEVEVAHRLDGGRDLAGELPRCIPAPAAARSPLRDRTRDARPSGTGSDA